MEGLYKNKVRAIAERMAEKFETIKINGEEMYRTEEGEIFMLEYVQESKMIGVGYADNLQDAKNNMFEDGDGYDITKPIETVIQELMKEINGE